MEAKDRSGFRVKFTGGEKKKSPPGKEMILGGRARPIGRDFNTIPSNVLKNQET